MSGTVGETVMLTGYNAPDLRTKKKKTEKTVKTCVKDYRRVGDWFHHVGDCTRRDGDRYDVSGTVRS